jgi:hypothetical protein
VIHDKFRAEVDQYLTDCKSFLEEFDAFQMELKGTADKQSKLHFYSCLFIYFSIQYAISSLVVGKIRNTA